MAKLQANYYYNKDGTKKINGYKITLSKSDCEKAGFNENSKLKIESKENELKIILDNN